MIPETHNSRILPCVPTVFVQMQQNVMVDILWGLWSAKGKVSAAQVCFDTHRHVWASWAQIMAVVDT